MPDFRFHCPHCGQRLAAPDDMIGERIECPACGSGIEVPDQGDAATELRPDPESALGPAVEPESEPALEASPPETEQGREPEPDVPDDPAPASHESAEAENPVPSARPRHGVSLFSAIVFVMWLFCFLVVLGVDVRMRRVSLGLAKTFPTSVLNHVLSVDNFADLDVDNEQLVQRDETRLRRLFPDEADYRRCLDWGRNLMVDGRAGVSRRRMTDARAAHAAWRRLVLRPWVREADLARIPQIVEDHLAGAPNRVELMAWAQYRRTQRHLPIAFDNGDVHVGPAVPDIAWFRYWILYEDWCLTDAAFEARQKAFLRQVHKPRRFGRYLWPEFLAWGAKLASERHAACGFPAASDRASYIAAMDRIEGIDEASRGMYAIAPPQLLLAPLTVGMFAAYPNGDIPHAATGLLTHALPPPQSAVEWVAFAVGHTFGWFVTLGLLLALARMVQRGMDTAILALGGRLLRVGEHDALLRYRYHVLHTNPRRWLIQFAAVVLALAVQPFTLDAPTLLLHRGVGSLVLAELWSTITCGLLVVALSHVVTLGVVRSGRDPHRVWVDDIVAAALSIPLLLYCGNALGSILAGIAFGLARKVLYRLAPAPDAATMAAAPAEADENEGTIQGVLASRISAGMGASSLVCFLGVFTGVPAIVAACVAFGDWPELDTRSRLFTIVGLCLGILSTGASVLLFVFAGDKF